MSFAPDIGLFVVADGMGGHTGGDEASRQACIAVEDHVRGRSATVSGYSRTPTPLARREVLRMLRDASRAANERIILEGDLHPDLSGMGSTMVAVLAAGDRAFVANVGDSRVYLIRDGGIALLTEDHSLFFELVRQGRLSRASAARFPYKNVVTRALGMRGTIEADCFDLELLPGDRLVLCTDGLHGVLDDEAVLGIAGAGAVQVAADALVAAANEAGGPDNVTVMVVEVVRIEGDPEAVRVRNEATRSLAMFQGLSTAEWVRVQSICQPRTFRNGEEVFREGETGDGLYGVLSGQIEVWRDAKPIQAFGPGTHFGELSLVEEMPRLATAVSRGASEVFVLPRRTFESLFRQWPQTSAKLLRNLLLILSRRLRNTNDELVVLKANYDAERLDVPQVLSADDLEEEP